MARYFTPTFSLYLKLQGTTVLDMNIVKVHTWHHIQYQRWKESHSVDWEFSQLVSNSSGSKKIMVISSNYTSSFE